MAPEFSLNREAFAVGVKPAVGTAKAFAQAKASPTPTPTPTVQVAQPMRIE